MNSRSIFALAALAAALLVAAPAHAVSYTLNASTAFIPTPNANTTSSFFEVSGSGAVSGSAASLYTAQLGGNEDSGFWVEIFFGVNPQPILTSAFLKAANTYLWWDASDLAAFNSGIFTSIRLENSGQAGSGIGHWTGGGNNTRSARQWKFNGTSHAGINGRPGEQVPDSASTVGLLALGLSVLGLVARRRKA